MMPKEIANAIVREFHFVDSETGVKSLIWRDATGNLVYTDAAGRVQKLPEALVPEEIRISESIPLLSASAELVPAPKGKRDNQAERLRAKGNRALRAAEVRIALAADNTDVMQLAQALILCGLPYRWKHCDSNLYRALGRCDDAVWLGSYPAALPAR
jgi:hypothetical protein